MSHTRLYLISPPSFEEQEFYDAFAAALKGGDVASLQLRLKDKSDEEIISAAEKLKPLCHAHDVALIINDRPDIARTVGADGVHLGQKDMNIEEAREIVGKDQIIGMTCHNSRHMAMTAGEQGADYVAFGAFFPSSTKETFHVAEKDLLIWWAEIFEVPCVAIGGITLENAPELIAAKADFIAVSHAVWNYKDGPKAAVERFNELF